MYFSKDHAEILKVAIELPKMSVSIVGFFSGSSALMLRFAEKASQNTSEFTIAAVSPCSFYSILLYLEYNKIIVAKAVFILAVVVSLFFLYYCYNFMSSIISSMSQQFPASKVLANNETTTDKDVIQDAVLHEKLNELFCNKYPKFKRWMNITTLGWAIILGAFVAFL